MGKKKSLSLLEIVLIVFPLTNALGIDRFYLKDTKWGLIRLVVALVFGGISFGIPAIGSVVGILWLIDLIFLILGRYSTDMLKYLK